jgi:hypothetical protein
VKGTQFPTTIYHLQTRGIWLIDYDGVRLCLRTVATNWLVVHPPDDMRVWRTVVMMILAGDNS